MPGVQAHPRFLRAVPSCTLNVHTCRMVCRSWIFYCSFPLWRAVSFSDVVTCSQALTSNLIYSSLRFTVYPYLCESFNSVRIPRTVAEAAIAYAGPVARSPLPPTILSDVCGPLRKHAWWDVSFTREVITPLRSFTHSLTQSASICSGTWLLLLLLCVGLLGDPSRAKASGSSLTPLPFTPANAPSTLTR